MTHNHRSPTFGHIVWLVAFGMIIYTAGCTSKKEEPQKPESSIEKPAKKPVVIGFVQPVDDETLDEARRGFIDALKARGYSDSAGTAKIIYQNAQNDIPALNQIIDKFIADKVTCIAANATLPMMTALKKTKEIPIFMMVGPAPTINDLTIKQGENVKAPANLVGVYETLAYIDSSIALIRRAFPNAKTIGVIFNSAEPNSTNAMGELRKKCKQNNLKLVERSITSTAETQQAVQAILSKKPDVFFALPDNLVFASFEVILKETSEKKVPIVTSEIGLVKRGATIAYGADFYMWGYQAGEAAAEYFDTGDLVAVGLRPVKVRKLVHNEKMAKELGFTPPPESQPM